MPYPQYRWVASPEKLSSGGGYGGSPSLSPLGMSSSNANNISDSELIMSVFLHYGNQYSKGQERDGSFSENFYMQDPQHANRWIFVILLLLHDFFSFHNDNAFFVDTSGMLYSLCRLRAMLPLARPASLASPPLPRTITYSLPRSRDMEKRMST